jgi:hypothetical protein
VSFKLKSSLYIKHASPNILKDCIESLGDIIFLGKETRLNHTATYPMHNRYFSNGDKPWVIIVNLKNRMKLNYDGIEYIINEHELVCFDDNIVHAWEMKNNNMEIYYYRAKSLAPINQGTYCINELNFK